jgi:hypothetical protein
MGLLHRRTAEGAAHDCAAAAFGLWWLTRAAARARGKGEGYGSAPPVAIDEVVEDEVVRQRATTAREFDPREVHRGHPGRVPPPIVLAALPLLVVVGVNISMTLIVLPRLDVSFLAEEHFGATTLSAVGGVWAVVTALLAAIVGPIIALAVVIALGSLFGSF